MGPCWPVAGDPTGCGRSTIWTHSWTRQITLAPVDEGQARLALRARIRFGRGMGHGGMLNFGDAFSYALARCREGPLLFVRNDFGMTDVSVALGPDRS